MSVRPILLQKNGAIFGTPGAYRALPPKMAGLYAGSDALEDVTYHTVNSSGEAELKTVKAYPFYVDSISGGADTSGDGTLANPWRSVHYSLIKVQAIINCFISNYCCYPYIVLRIKGTLDYGVYGLSVPNWDWPFSTSFNGYDKVIIEPWESENIDFNIIPYSIHANGFTGISNVILKNINVNITAHGIAFANCMNSIFNNVNFNILDAISYSGSSEGFFQSHNSIFYECHGEIIGYINNPYPAGFHACENSIFHKSSAIISGSPLVVAFYYNENSSFFECFGQVTSSLNGCGFLSNTNSTFFNCNGNTVGSITCDI